jgi:hypothetical protein
MNRTLAYVAHLRKERKLYGVCRSCKCLDICLALALLCSKLFGKNFSFVRCTHFVFFAQPGCKGRQGCQIHELHAWHEELTLLDTPVITNKINICNVKTKPINYNSNEIYVPCVCIRMPMQRSLSSAPVGKSMNHDNDCPWLKESNHIPFLSILKTTAFSRRCPPQTNRKSSFMCFAPRRGRPGPRRPLRQCH